MAEQRDSPPRRAAPVKPGASAESAPRGRAVTAPTPPRRDRLSAWLLLLAWLAAASPALLIELARPHVRQAQEATTLATSIETWRNVLLPGEQWLDWLSEPPTPRYNGRPQLDRPPGVTYLHLLAFTGLDRDQASIEQLKLRGRIVSAAAGMLAIASLFWVGYSLGAVRTAAIAAVVCLASPLLLYHGRHATAAAPHLAFSLLSTAAALWAARPLRPRPALTRQLLGWLICGLATAAAIACGGAIALPILLGPLLLIMLICPYRFGHVLGLLASLTLATLILLPWVAYVHGQEPDVWRKWLEELRPTPLMQVDLLGTTLGWRGLTMLLILLPWTAWVIAGLTQPFSTSSAGARRRMFLSWTWLVGLIALMLAAPDTRRIGGMLILLPAAAMVVAQLFTQFADLSDEGRHARQWRVLRWPHLAVFAVASAAVPAWFILEPALIEAGHWNLRTVAVMPWFYWTGVGVILLGLVILSFRWATKQYPGRTVVGWALWVLVLLTTVMVPASRGPLVRGGEAAEARRIAGYARGYPLYWLTADPSQNAVDPRVVFYAERIIPPLPPRLIEEAVREHGAIYMLTTASTRLPDLAGVTLASIEPLSALDLRLWLYTRQTLPEPDRPLGHEDAP